MSPPVSERAEPIVPDVGVAPTLRPSYGARTAQRAVPTITLSRYETVGYGRSSLAGLQNGARRAVVSKFGSPR